MDELAEKHELDWRSQSTVYVREGREGQFCTDELLALYEVRWKGTSNSREVQRAIIINMLDSLLSQIDAGIAPSQGNAPTPVAKTVSFVEATRDLTDEEARGVLGAMIKGYQLVLPDPTRVVGHEAVTKRPITVAEIRSAELSYLRGLKKRLDQISVLKIDGPPDWVPDLPPIRICVHDPAGIDDNCSACEAAGKERLLVRYENENAV